MRTSVLYIAGITGVLGLSELSASLLNTCRSNDAVHTKTSLATHTTSTTPSLNLFEKDQSVLKPRGTYSNEVVAEISSAKNPVNIKRISLENKSLAFAGTSSVFDEEEVDKIVKVITNKMPNLEILDISQGRLPEEALTYFSDLLLNDNFKYLDVRQNNGASTLDAIRTLSEYLGNKLDEMGDLKRSEKISRISRSLNKVIWLPENFLDSDASKQLPPETIKAHREYFLKRKTS